MLHVIQLGTLPKDLAGEPTRVDGDDARPDAVLICRLRGCATGVIMLVCRLSG